MLQIEALQVLFAEYPETRETVTLVMVGGVRGPQDLRIVEDVRALITKMGLESHVRIIQNASFSDLNILLESCSIGLHTMTNEHFGISVVEYMAAGLIPIAHNSGGPAADIISSAKYGYLATSKEDYAQCIYEAISLPNEKQHLMRSAARKHVHDRFSDATFAKRFIECLCEVC